MAQEVNYSPVEPAVTIPAIVTCFQHHAALVWVVLPLSVLVQALVPGLKPTCESGFSNISLVVPLVVIAHYLYAESRAWAAAMALLAPRELAVMRQLGVLANRRLLRLLGALEEAYLYMNLVFPLVARSCEPALHQRWIQSWLAIPVVGEFTVKTVENLRFWGLALIFVAGISLAGLIAFFQLLRGKVTANPDGLAAEPNKDQDPSYTQLVASSGVPPRLNGEVFFSLANFAEVATMPSVAHLCEEMGLQRRWTFDPKLQKGGAQVAMRVREDIVFGKLPEDVLVEYELQDNKEFERVEGASMFYSVFLLVGKVLVWQGLQLFIQAAFLEVSFGSLGQEGLVKLLVGMALSGLNILTRSAQAAKRLGCLGYLLSLLNVLLVTVAAAKVYFAFACEDHIWNIGSGCLSLASAATSVI